MSVTVRDLMAACEGMAEVLGELAYELVGCTENSPEEARLAKIADALDAYVTARDALKLEA